MSLASNDNFSMTVEAYLAKHHIMTYLEDSITQLLECREENPKVVPTQFFSEYFRSLQDGRHTMLREFAYIKSTPHNRMSFVVLFWKCFQQIGKKGDLLSIQEYHSLLGLLCPDFPFQIVQNIARIVLIDDALDCLISFSDFIYAFQVQFYFEEFLAKSNEIYQGLLQTINSPRDPVIVPTSGDSDAAVHRNTHQPTDGVDAMQFFRAIYPLLNRADYSTPPLASLKEILFNVPCISFYEFLTAIAKLDSINTYIGRLPGKTDLLQSEDAESRPVSRQQQKTPRWCDSLLFEEFESLPHPIPKVSSRCTTADLHCGDNTIFWQKSKQKFKKANEIPVSRTSQKVPGASSQSKPSSGLLWSAASVSADGMSATNSAPFKTQQQSHNRRDPILTAPSPETGTDSDSDSSAESSESN